MGFLGGASGKESACQCRSFKRLECNSWVRRIPWRRKWQPTPVFLLGKSHIQRSLEGYSPWGCKEPDTTENHSGMFKVFWLISFREERGTWLLAAVSWVLTLTLTPGGPIASEPLNLTPNFSVQRLFSCSLRTLWSPFIWIKKVSLCPFQSSFPPSLDPTFLTAAVVAVTWMDLLLPARSPEVPGAVTSSRKHWCLVDLPGDPRSLLGGLDRMSLPLLSAFLPGL